MSLEDIPSYLASTTGINETTAQLILTAVIICSLLFPYLIMTKGNPNTLITLILIFLGDSIALGLGWSPFWIMIMLIVLTVSGVALLGAKGVTGG